MYQDLNRPHSEHFPQINALRWNAALKAAVATAMEGCCCYFYFIFHLPSPVSKQRESPPPPLQSEFESALKTQGSVLKVSGTGGLAARIICGGIYT